MKKTITLASLALLLIITVISCKKDIPATPPSAMSLIIGKQWQTDTLYYNYTGPGTGTLEYARGGSSNILNYDDDIAAFWPDGNEDILDNGSYEVWTWSLNTDGTVITIVTTGGTVIATIEKLDATHFNYYDATNHTLEVLVYVP
jgi:hypothetical protein